MNPKHLGVRVSNDGTIFLTEERNRTVKRLKNITNDVMFALCADLIGQDGADENVTKVERSIRFGDGTECLITVQLIKEENP